MSSELDDAKRYIADHEQWVVDHPGQSPWPPMKTRYADAQKVVQDAAVPASTYEALQQLYGGYNVSAIII